MLHPVARRSISLSLVALMLLAAVGCGPAPGTITGSVTYKEKPVLSGSVSVIASDNIQYVGTITPEGTYTIPNVPGGPVKFSVTSPNDSVKRPGTVNPGPFSQVDGGNPPPVPQPQAGPTTWFPIPEKYADPQASGLTGTVRSNTTINLELQ